MAEVQKYCRGETKRTHSPRSAKEHSRPRKSTPLSPPTSTHATHAAHAQEANTEEGENPYKKPETIYMSPVLQEGFLARTTVVHCCCCCGIVVFVRSFRNKND